MFPMHTTSVSSEWRVDWVTEVIGPLPTCVFNHIHNFFFDGQECPSQRTRISVNLFSGLVEGRPSPIGTR